MQSVAQGYDPGNALFAQWFEAHESTNRNLVVNVGGGKSQVWPFLAEQFPTLKIEVRDASQALLTQRQDALSPKLKERVTFKQHDLYAPQPLEDAAKVYTYVMWNVCWNLDDANCVKLIQTFVPVLEESPQTILLVNEGMSPPRGMFEQHIDHAYRRRDVTAMTMHNTKLRSEEEWRELFNQASPYFKVRSIQPITSTYVPHFFASLYMPALLGRSLSLTYNTRSISRQRTQDTRTKDCGKCVGFKVASPTGPSRFALGLMADLIHPALFWLGGIPTD
jgi:hypothetical protein